MRGAFSGYGQALLLGLCWAFCLGVLPAGLVQADEQAPRAPEYEVTPCCTLCPEAADRSRYASGFLKVLRVLVQGRENWLFRTDQELKENFGPQDPAAYQGLGRINRGLLARHIRLVLVYTPTKGLVHPSKLTPDTAFDFQAAAAHYRRTVALIRKQGVIVPDLTPLFDEQKSKEFYFRRDHHWTPYGARRTAKLVAAAIRELPEYATLAKQQFVTRRVGLLGKVGTLQVGATALCGQAYPGQYVEKFATTLAQEEDDFLGEAKLPAITLVGTSFSKSSYNYNFVGFLKEFLQTDILNEAAPGSGYAGSLEQYLLSEEFRQAPPRILIWEVPSYYDITHPMLPRQVMALLDGGCAGRPALLQSRVRLHPGTNEVLFNGGGQIKDIHGRDYLVDLRFSDPDYNKLVARIWYINGRRESIRAEFSKRLEKKNRFVFELASPDPAVADATFVSLDVDVKKERQTPLSVNAIICRRQATPGESP